jgi:hypothetical protein
VITLSPGLEDGAQHAFDDIDDAMDTQFQPAASARNDEHESRESAASPRPRLGLDLLSSLGDASADELLSMGDATRLHSPPARSSAILSPREDDDDDDDEDPDGQLFYTSLLNAERSRLRRRVASALSTSSALSDGGSRRLSRSGNAEQNERPGNMYSYTFETPDEAALEWGRRVSATWADNADSPSLTTFTRHESDRGEHPVLVLYCGRRAPLRPRLPPKFRYIDDNDQSPDAPEGGCGALVCARAMTVRDTSDTKATRSMFTTDLPPRSQAISFLNETSRPLDGSSNCTCVRVSLGCRTWYVCSRSFLRTREADTFS